MAPLDNQSGAYQGTKSPKHVNTRARKAMMTAVCRHMACVPESRAYYDKKRAEGKKNTTRPFVLWGAIYRELFGPCCVMTETIGTPFRNN